jgi:hypothetical protein
MTTNEFTWVFGDDGSINWKSLFKTGSLKSGFMTPVFFAYIKASF